jgi:murein DD-endopeptidase MepM/ murein hydrolase activator NlpD
MYNRDGIKGRVIVEELSGLALAEKPARKSLIEKSTSDAPVKKPAGDVLVEELTSNASIKEPGGVLVEELAGGAINVVKTATGLGDGDGSLSEEAGKKSAKYGYKAGKYAAQSVSSAVKGANRLINKELMLAALSRSGAPLAALGRSGANLAALDKSSANHVTSGKTKVVPSILVEVGSGLAAAGGSAIKIITSEIKEKAIQSANTAICDSGELGVQAIKLKGRISNVRKAAKTSAAAGKAIKKGAQGTVKALRGSVRTVQKTARFVKYTVSAIKTVFSNPLALKGTLIVAATVLSLATALAAASAIAAMIPTITLKSENRELTKTYEYITKLDANLLMEILELPNNWSHRDIYKYHYYMNGVKTDAKNIMIYTDAEMILLYLDVKYDDYSFETLIPGIFGESVKDELTSIHNKLYSYSTYEWEEIIKHTSYRTDPVNGDTITTIWYETRTHLNINVSTNSFESYLSDNIDQMLTQEEQERITALKTAGIFTTMQRLSSPFKDQSYTISSRWGWRIHPISGAVSKHTGIDIPKEAGTPINNVMFGEVTKVVFDPDGYGNYAVISWGKNEVLYAHMSYVSVSAGQELKKGDIVGYVGTTGSSTGNHLHLEYSIENGLNTNPAFFLDGAYTY